MPSGPEFTNPEGAQRKRPEHSLSAFEQTHEPERAVAQDIRRIRSRLADVRGLLKNTTSRRDTPPVRVHEQVTPSPETAFLVRGELFKLVKGNLPGVADIAASLVTGKPRDFTMDSERLAEKIEQAQIEGVENIPLTHDPMIIACNHPDIYDVVAGIIHITSAVSRERKDHDQPGDIHWLIATSIPPREAVKLKRYKGLYAAINKGFRMLHKTYEQNFIPVPMDTNPDHRQARAAERLETVRRAEAVLNDETGSRIIGIFPEGDVTKGASLDTFHAGVGMLARSAASPDGLTRTSVVPTGISRDEHNRLTIKFGKPVVVSREENPQEITERVRSAVGQVSELLP